MNTLPFFLFYQNSMLSGTCVRQSANHVFMSIYAAFQLECLKLKHKMNHFALRNRIYITALQQAMRELHLLKSA
jgi:hypothetical protein